MTLLSLFVCLGVSSYGIYEMRKARSSIPSFDQFVWQEGEEWVIDARLGKLIEAVGSRMALSMRQSFFQAQGVEAKLTKNVDKAIGLDIMDTTGIGGILDLLGMGNTKNMLAKNPRTLGLIVQRVAPLLQNVNFGGASQGNQEMGKY